MQESTTEMFMRNTTTTYHVQRAMAIESKQCTDFCHDSDLWMTGYFSAPQLVGLLSSH